MARRWHLLFFVASVVYVAAFAAMTASHVWLWDAQGALVPYDFIDVYAAGKLALAHHPASAYDWPSHRIAEAAALHHPLAWKDYFGWHYPPPFLFAAAVLALLPYLAAFFAWSAATLPLYLLSVQRIVGRPGAWLAAFAFPATFYNISVGQNGFLTAALIGGSLATLEERPILSGVLLGLLTYKPQFGILFPFALAACGYWRSVAAAAATAIVLATASWLTFGGDAWFAFVHSVPVTVDAVFMRGLEGWSKLNSVYGFCRWSGAGAGAAAATQIALDMLLIGAVFVLWRSKAPFALKAAALATATLLATPYAYIYDFPILAVAIAFLWRQQAFDFRETFLVAIACGAVAAFPFTHVAIGLAATFAVAAIVILRCPMHRPSRLAALAPQGDAPTYRPTPST
jgi:arabinofuranan 3-O-arabinosyltransferase